MLKKTLFFQNACHLNVRYNQLVITQKNSGEITTRPIEDLGVVLFDHPQITFTQAVLQHLASHNVAVIVCDEKHHPASCMFHLDTHQTQNENFRAQIEASEPLKKQLWQQTVKAKIRNQAKMLAYIQKDTKALTYLARQVKSGDTTNEEAKAARIYWPLVFGDDFYRRRYGLPPNHLLNYGYAILRAGIAKALMGSGLLPTLGIHHRNKYNAFCLADDIMEPYRPYVDMMVHEMWESGVCTETITTEDKKQLLGLYVVDVRISSQKRPLLDALSQTTASLSRCFQGLDKKITYPVL
jgi:CRISP-associated protein Cas1